MVDRRVTGYNLSQAHSSVMVQGLGHSKVKRKGFVWTFALDAKASKRFRLQHVG